MDVADIDLRDVDKILAKVEAEQVEIDKEVAAAEATKKNSTSKNDTASTSTVIITNNAQKRSLHGAELNRLAGFHKIDNELLLTSDRIKKTKDGMEKVSHDLVGIHVDFATPNDLMKEVRSDLSTAEAKLRDFTNPQFSETLENKLLWEVENSFKKAERSMKRTAHHMESIYKCFHLHIECESKLI